MGERVSNKTTCCGRSMDIFWNNIFQKLVRPGIKAFLYDIYRSFGLI